MAHRWCCVRSPVEVCVHGPTPGDSHRLQCTLVHVTPLRASLIRAGPAVRLGLGGLERRLLQRLASRLETL
jgi:hypothetical protein